MHHPLKRFGCHFMPTFHVHVFSVTLLCSTAAANEEGIWTSAPPELSLDDLGKPVDYNFNILSGSNSESLYPKRKTTKRAGMAHSLKLYDNTVSIKAHARAWGIEAKVSTNDKINLAVYQAYQTVKYHQAIDTDKRDSFPSKASYYIAGIETGFSYGAVFWSNERNFKSALKAGFMTASGSFETAAKRYQLQWQALGRGMRPTTKHAIFTTSDAAIEKNYRVDRRHPVPIRVYYRPIENPNALRLGRSQYKSKFIGSYGGKESTIRCRGLSAITQFAMRYGKLVDRLGATCTTLGDFETTENSEEFGGTSGKPGSVRCETGQYAVGIHGRAAARIDSLGLLCAAPKEWFQRGKPTREPALGGPGGKDFQEECPSGFVLVGVTVRVGRYAGLLHQGDVVNAISVQCQQLATQ